MAKPKTPIGRLSFPALFVATKPKGDNNAEPKYNMTLLMDADAQKTPEFKQMQEAVKAALLDKFKTPPNKWKSPFLTIADLDEVPDGYDEDCVFVRMSSKTKPGVVGPNPQFPIEDADEAYAGCYVRVSYNVYAWDHPTGGKGVSIGLGNVQKIKDGTPFGNRTKAEDDFDMVESEETDAHADMFKV
jgi:hypothetical protein